MGENNKEDTLFWADKVAEKVVNRKKFHYLDKKVPKIDTYTIKTAASLSGVLHIGRLSDTVRNASIQRALDDLGKKARIVWTSDDMDPFRAVPEGIPASYEKYLGMPVTDIPDPEGCHKSYAEHFRDQYMGIIDQFIFSKIEKYSVREEYKKGSFNPSIKKIVDNLDTVREIVNKYRTNPLGKNWSPWAPVCENCGKLATTAITGFEDGRFNYICRDYLFRKTVAKGCGHRGTSNPLKDPGKLLYRGEWAAQWALWNVSCEGAGKEYIVPNSAFWTNAEIAEKVLGIPAPESFFYEHLMIDGVKMSASLGNVVYPQDWLKVATAQQLIYFYNKRLMKTRSFSWKDLPQLYDEYDYAARVYAGDEKIENEKEERHIKRLYELANKKRAIQKPINLGFSHAAFISQVFENKDDVIKSLKKTGHYQPELEKEIFERIEKASNWLNSHAPDEAKFTLQEKVVAKLSDKQKKAMKLVAASLKEKKWTEKTLFEEFYNICKKTSLTPREFFQAGYLVLLNREKGPKLASFVLALGEKATKLFDQV
ncbi:MAG: lysine--tRNA ligase [bacterium]|nr:lysine--tRNA ligase [bacterium]